MLIKKFLLLLLAFSFLLIQCEKKAGDHPLSEKGERAQKIIATFVLGKVMAKSNETNLWEPVKVGKQIGLNDMIKVAENSRVSLQTETGSVVVIKDASELKVTSLLNPKTGEENTDLALNSGKAVINPRKLEGNSKFAVRTPAMVAGVRGTVFSVEYRSGESKVSVQEGKVAVKALVSKQNEEKVKEVSVKPGEKAEVTLAKVEEINKKLDQKAQTVSQDKAIEEVVEVKTMNTEEKDTSSQDKKEIVKLDISMAGEQIVAQSGDKKDTSLGSITISSFGSEIFVNSTKVASDYFSSLYPQGVELNIEIKKQNQIILQQKIVVQEKGIELNLTPAEELKKEIDTLNQKDFSTLYSKVGEGYPSNSDSIIQLQSGYAFIAEGFVKISQTGNDKIISIPYHMKVKPCVTEKAIFVVNKGNLEVYSPTGQKMGEAEVNNNIVFNTAITFYKNNAYMANSVGTIVGISSEGSKVFGYSLKDTITAPVSVSDNYVVTASPYKVYVLDAKNSNLIASFKPGAKVFKKIGIIGNTLLIPQENNSIMVTDLNGKVLRKIAAVAENIEVISPQLFMIKYITKTSVYNTEGQKVKEVASGKSFMKDGKLIYADGKTLVIDNFSSEKRVDLTETIKAIGDSGTEISILTDTGKIFKVAY